ncbi:hypothetical protein CRENBAI_026447 [Crenichthys baileyi]|uniref:Uncharacterized protein n=1 Tax=Crenichthys baileyi TaxID=28760 RepID=A0AAV9RAY1_9TELE
MATSFSITEDVKKDIEGPYEPMPSQDFSQFTAVSTLRNTPRGTDHSKRRGSHDFATNRYPGTAKPLQSQANIAQPEDHNLHLQTTLPEEIPPQQNTQGTPKRHHQSTPMHSSYQHTVCNHTRPGSSSLPEPPNTPEEDVDHHPSHTARSKFHENQGDPPGPPSK